MRTAARQIIGCATSKRLGYQEFRLLWPNGDAPWPLSPRALLVASREALLVPLQDGLLTAAGRLSRRPADPKEKRRWGRSWIMHSSRHTAIPIEAWHEGQYDWRSDTLEVANGQYVDIQLLKILVEALWPDLDNPTPIAPARTLQDAVYTTPYLRLMLQAIDDFRIGAGGQPKKDVLVEWFRERHVGGLRVSSNMANYLATFIRPPETQRGGNRKWSGAPSS